MLKVLLYLTAFIAGIIILFTIFSCSQGGSDQPGLDSWGKPVIHFNSSAEPGTGYSGRGVDVAVTKFNWEN